MVPDGEVDAYLETLLRGRPEGVVQACLSTLSLGLGHRVFDASHVVHLRLGDEGRNQRDALARQVEAARHRVEHHQGVPDGNDPNRCGDEDEQEQKRRTEAEVASQSAGSRESPATIGAEHRDAPALEELSQKHRDDDGRDEDHEKSGHGQTSAVRED